MANDKHKGPYSGAAIDEGIRRTYEVFHNDCELLNWYMPVPVNQRGIVSGATISTPGYFLDGWKLVSGSCIWTLGQRLAISDESVVVQYLEKYYGAMLDKTYTFSIDTPDGIKSVTFKFPAAVSGETVYTETGIAGYCTIKAGFEYRSGGTAICGTTQYYVPFIEITAADDIDIIPYLEPHNVSTMANATQPDYGEQLALCQRFYIRLSSGAGYGVYGFGNMNSATGAFIFLNLPVTMRVKPTIVYSGSIEVKTFGTVATSTVSAMSVSQFLGHSAMITATTGTLTTGLACCMQNKNDASAYIELIADL